MDDDTLKDLLRQYVADHPQEGISAPAESKLRRELRRLAAEEAQGEAQATSEDVADLRQHWATATVQAAAMRCQEHFEKQRKAAHWEAFDRIVLTPSMSGNTPPRRDIVAEELGFRDAPAVTAALQVVRGRMKIILAALVAETVDDATQADRELDYLIECLRITDTKPGPPK